MGHTAKWMQGLVDATTVVRADDGKPICVVIAPVGHSEQGEIARLIASAPDLLAERDRLRESNKELLEACKKAMTCGLDSSVREVVWAAIRRATSGGAQEQEGASK